MAEKMTIHRALAELKLADSKIEKLISEIIPTATHQKGKPIEGHITNDQFAKDAQSKFDAITDLINRKVIIKKLIVESNAKTSVTIAGSTMTVADALSYQSIVEYRRKFIDTLRTRQRATVAMMNRCNDGVNSNLQKLLEITLSKEALKKGGNDVDAVRTPYLENNEFHYFDPLKVEERITEMEKEVMGFESEVDAALSESNAVTFIEL